MVIHLQTIFTILVFIICSKHYNFAYSIGDSLINIKRIKFLSIVISFIIYFPRCNENKFLHFLLRLSEPTNKKSTSTAMSHQYCILIHFKLIKYFLIVLVYW